MANAREALRVLALVAGAAGAATAVLGGYALTGSRSARLGLSVLALPVFVGGLGVGGFMSAFVVVGIGALWLQPTRSWFAGVVPPEPPSARRAADRPPTEAPREQQARVPAGSPGHPGVPAAPPSGQVPGPFQGYGVPAAPSQRHQPPARRPGSVMAACLVTWISTGLVAGLVAITGLVMLTAPDVLFEELRRQEADILGQISEGEARSATLVVCGLALAWCVGAVVAAVATFQGRPWGWMALLISCGLVGVLSLALLVGSLALVVPLAASAATFGLLLRPESRAWCGRPGR